jgi:hypothetical protein
MEKSLQARQNELAKVSAAVEALHGEIQEGARGESAETTMQDTWKVAHGAWKRQRDETPGTTRMH